MNFIQSYKFQKIAVTFLVIELSNWEKMLLVQYSTLEIIEISPVPGSISNQILEEQVCKTLPLTGIKVEDKDLYACHRMERRSRVNLKFEDRKLKYQVMANRKKLMEKKNELKELHFKNLFS